MKTWLLASAAMLAAFSLPGEARADVVTLGMSGAGIAITMTLTYSPTSPQGVLDSQPNINYPTNSYMVTGIAGTFTDTNIGIFNAAITGMRGLSPETARDAVNLLAPPSLSFISATPQDLSYDNLYYPGGSPQSATYYPFHGGLFDIYGLAFEVDGGYTVNVWSDGYDADFSGFGGPKLTGLHYGAAVLGQGTVAPGFVPQADVLPLQVADYQLFGLSVPEPASMLVLGAGLLGLAAARRRSHG